MESRNNLDRENSPHAYVPNTAPVSAPQPPYSKPTPSSALSLPWPNNHTRTGVSSPVPPEPVVPAARAIFAAAPEPKLTSPTVLTPVQPLALEPTTRAFTQPAASLYADLDATVPAPVPTTRRPIHSQTTPPAPTPEHKSTTAPEPEQPLTRGQASPLTPATKDKDKHKVGKSVVEAAATAVTVVGVAAEIVNNVQAGNGNNIPKPPDTSWWECCCCDCEGCWDSCFDLC